MLSHSKKLMEARLGVYEKAPYSPIEATEDMSIRLHVEGGYRQQERMIQAKRKAFDRALFNSYQAAEIEKIGEKECARALINPNVTKQDYDDKILSVGYEHNFKPGDVFKWNNTNTHWLIYLQDLTELAYFKGDIRKCNYQINWKDGGKIYSSWIAVRGPVETKIDFLQKNGIGLDVPNHSLNILMPKTEEALRYFKRYSKFYLLNSDSETANICWRVEATDTISMPGILEVIAVEYYSNEAEDDLEKGIVGGLIIEEPKIESEIQGKDSIKPRIKYLYSYTGTDSGEWSVDSKYPIEIVQKSDKSIELTWLKSFSGQFSLSYGKAKKEITVDSLF